MPGARGWVGYPLVPSRAPQELLVHSMTLFPLTAPPRLQLSHCCPVLASLGSHLKDNLTG